MMQPNESLVSAQDVSFSYEAGGREVLRGVSVEVERGVFLGLLGPNGGGKTTLIRLILGQIRPRAGRVFVLGRPAHEMGAARLRIGYVPQRNRAERAFPATVRDVVRMGSVPQAGLLRPLGARTRRRAEELMERVGIADAADCPISEVGGGQAQRAYLARALMPRPRLLLLDEPTSGVDAAGKQQLIALLSELLADQDLTILMVSHDVGLVVAAADRVACLDGELHFHDRPEHLTDETLRRAYRCDLAAAAAFGHEVTRLAGSGGGAGRPHPRD